MKNKHYKTIVICAFLAPNSIMTGLFFGIVSDYGLFNRHSIQLNAPSFVDQYGMGIIVAGALSFAGLATAIALYYIDRLQSKT